MASVESMLKSAKVALLVSYRMVNRILFVPKPVRYRFLFPFPSLLAVFLSIYSFSLSIRSLLINKTTNLFISTKILNEFLQKGTFFILKSYDI